MIFRVGGKNVSGGSAIEVVRALERADGAYRHVGGSIRQYLLLLDEYGVGKIVEPTNRSME